MRFGQRRDPRVADEIRFHRERLIEQYIAEGMDRRAAERRAFLEFGNPAQIEEEVRDVRGRWLTDLAQDARYALRTLRRNPVFAAVAVLSFALGIGANTTIFSLVNAVILRTLPVEQADRLVQLGRMSTTTGRASSVSYPVFEHLRDNMTSVSSLFAHATTAQSIFFGDDDDSVTTDFVSGHYFVVLGLVPAAGRLLAPSDDVPAPSVLAAVITDRYWQRRFGRSPSVVGTTFTLRDRVFTIVGVTPPAYTGAQSGRASDLMVPLVPMMTEQQRASIGSNTLGVLARLKPGVTVAQASAEVDVLFRAFLQERSAALPDPAQRAAVLRQRAAAFPAAGGFNPLRDNFAKPLLILMGIVGLILLLACVNLSGLLLARAAARQREISIRLAIGAGRGRLVRQFLTESLVLALLGGGVGLLMTGRFSQRLFELVTAGREVQLSVAPDWRVIAFTAALALTACALAGLAPALQAARAGMNPALKDVAAHGHTRLGRTLVVSQFAMSMVLVVGATLFVGTLVKLYAVDPGFKSDGVLVLNVRSTRPLPPDRATAVGSALVERLSASAGVRAASAARVLPVEGNLWDRTIQVEGYAFRSGESNSVGFNAIAPGYFATMGTPLLSGRDFGDRDTGTAPKVAIVNASFERYFFGDRSALGRRVTSVGATYEIVGVVRDAKYQNLRDEILKTMYIPWAQGEDQGASYSYLARVAEGDPLRLVPGVERMVREVDPSLRVQRVSTYAAMIERSISTERVMATLGGLFGLLALVVAGLGMFGVLAFQVARRTNELGVRMVLGARRSSVMGLVLRDVAAMIVPGIAIGAGVALMLTDIARGILFDFTPSEASVFVVAACALGLTALLAGWFPALRASRVDPLIALRHE
ncbi:MAG TPA: ABC transporter permease [Vicinamibacterales bacterium]|nr:ABC transporter permease [Vicinamibacterales bacterium]